MRVVLINSVYQYGSTGKIVKYLEEEYILNGIECKVIYGRKKQAQKDGYVNSLTNFSKDVLSSLFFSNAGFNSSENTKNIIKILDDFTPDIVHIHNVHGFYVNLELLLHYLNDKNIKIFFTMHDCWLFTGFCAHYEYNQCLLWKNGCKNCCIKDTYPYRFFYSKKKISGIYDKKKKILTNKDITFICPSGWLLSQIRKSFLLNEDVKMIHNGISLDNFYVLNKLKNRELFKEEKILLSVASVWNEKKGLKDLIRLSSIINEDFVIVIVGLTKRQIKSLPAHIHGMARTNSIEELRNLYNEAYLFLNLTYEDTFPTVNIEALACGLPVISYNSGGSGEIIGTCGRLVETGDLNAVVSAIHELDVCENLKCQCTNRAIELFNEKKMTSNYIDLYKSLGSNNREDNVNKLGE